MSLLLALTAGGPTSYTLTCDAGAYAIAGSDATLSVGRRLVCDAGAYVIAGQAATLARGYALVCSPGAYAIVGKDATLTYTPRSTSYALLCDVGAYTIAGQAATLTKVSGRVETYSGGYDLPTGRRKTKREVYAERVRLGIIKEDIAIAAEKVVEKAIAPAVKTDVVELPSVDQLVNELMLKLRVTVKSPDYTRAIELALKIAEQDDEDVLFLMAY